ncbi:MAG: glycoside hydrolase family 5 protein [Granulosicoccus sp.]
MKSRLFVIAVLIGICASTVLYGADPEQQSVSRPSAPVLVAPAGSVSDTSPSFSWNASPAATWYYLWISGPGGKVFGKWFTEAQLRCVDGAGICSVKPAQTLDQGLFHWWVRPWNNAGNGPWSDRLNFTVGEGAPGAATLISPSGIVATNRAVYTWNAVAESTWYYLWVNDYSGTSVKRWYTAAQVDCASGSGTCSINPGIFVSGDSTWWIRTWNNRGIGPWSAGRSFTGEPGADIELRNKALGRGINLANALDAPNEGEWGWSLAANHFDIIADAGFDSVRVPIRWSAHAATTAPYAIDQAFFERVDWVLDQTARTGLTTVIDVHHYLELMVDPTRHRARFLSIWQQISERYAQRPETVYFEILNEPTEAFTDDPAIWNNLLADALQIVRRTNATRPVVIGPVGWNAIEYLDQLVLPTDPNVIVSVHFYSPFEFTHQGADWVEPIPPLGTEWFADIAQLGSTLENWSWFTNTTSLPGALQIDYDRQYAALSMHSTSPLSAHTFSIETSGTASLAVMCGVGDSYSKVDTITHRGTAWGRYTADLSTCVDGAENFALENQLAGKQSIKLRGGELCSSTQCNPVISTEAEAVRELLEVASDWGNANARPIFVGEFGAHSLADMASRARYVKHTQDSIHALGMSSSHWGFASTFAAYDLSNGRWHAPLLTALIPQE